VRDPAGQTVRAHLELQPSPIKVLAMQHHVPIFQPGKIRDPSAMEQLRYQRPM